MGVGSSRLSALRRGRRLGFRDLLDAALAQAHILRARLAVVFTPRGQLLRMARPAPGAGTLAPDDTERIRQIALAVERASEYGLFPPTCLVRSIALERLLKRERLDAAVVRIGVRDRDGRIEAHAWIEVDGTVVGDRREHTETFTPLHDFTAVAGT